MRRILLIFRSCFVFLKKEQISRSVDLFRVVYIIIVLVQTLTVIAYEVGLIPEGLAVLPALAASLAGPLLSFLICLHNFHQRRSELKNIVSATLSYLVTFTSYGIIYWILASASPGSFTMGGNADQSMDFTNSLYFSITTITSTGYGDIYPLTKLARSSAASEMIVGLLYQIFVFSFVASLIGSSMRNDKK